MRRRWYLVLVPVLLGVVLGWFSAPEAVTVRPGVPTATVSYYRASHVLVGEPPATGAVGEPESAPLALNRAAYLVNTGEVPERVAEQLELPIDEVRRSLLGLPREQVTSVEVQGFATDSGRAEALADAAALNLQAVLKEEMLADAERTRAALQAQIDTVGAQINELTGRIDSGALDQAQLEAERTTLSEQYDALLRQQSGPAGASESTPALTTLQEARATTISKAEYDNASKVIRDGADYVTGVTVPVEEGGGFSGPSVGASRSTRAGLGGILGLAVGVGLVLLLNRLDSRLRSRERVEMVTGLAVVGEIPPLSTAQQKAREVVAHTEHRSRAAEAYRVVRGVLLYAMSAPEIAGAHAAPSRSSNGEGETAPASHEATVVMVSSPSPSEGKTTTVANMAAVLAEGGLRVLVINCDFRRPLIQRYLLHSGIDSEHSDAAEGDDGGQKSALVVDTEIELVRLVTGIGEGDPDANPLEVLTRQRRVIEAARPRFDVILLDTAPFLTTNDANALFDMADHMLLVIRAGQTRADAAERAVEVLDRFEVPVLGVVLTNSEDAIAAQYYYDGYTNRSRRAVKRDRQRDEAARDLESATRR